MQQLKTVGHSFRTSEAQAKNLAKAAKNAKMTKTSYIIYMLGLDK